jgi:hypothetical protein
MNRSLSVDRSRDRVTGLWAGSITRGAIPAVGEVLLFTGLLGLAAAMRLVHIGDASGDLDEGIRGIQLLLMADGYRPFHELYSSQGPLLLDLLFPLYRAFGETMTATRLAVATYSLVAIAGAYWIGRELAGRVGGALCALLLILSPTYLENSRFALAETVALGPAMLGVGSMLAYRRTSRLAWLLASAGFVAISLLVKPIAVAVVVPIGLVCTMGTRHRRRNLTLVAGAAGAIIAVAIAAVGPAGIFDEIVDYRLRALQSDNWRLWDNWTTLTATLVPHDLPLLAVGSVGAIGLAALRPRVGIPLAAWGAATGAVLLAYSPLFPKHAATVPPPLAIAAGTGLASLANWSSTGLSRLWRIGLSFGLLGWLLVAALTSDLGIMGLRTATEPREFSDESDPVRTIATLSEPNSFVLTDHPYLAFLAQRPVPPPLADPSATRIRADKLTGPDIIAAATTYPSTVAVFRTDRVRALSSFQIWFDQRYRAVKIYGFRRELEDKSSARYVYVRQDADLSRARDALTAELAQHADATFAGRLRLGAYGIGSAELVRDGTVSVTLEWEALRRIAEDHRVTLQLVGADGRTWDTEELPLFAPGDNPNDWARGRWIVQAGTLMVPPEMPAGDYRVVVSVAERRAHEPLVLDSAGAPGSGNELTLEMLHLD